MTGTATYSIICFRYCTNLGLRPLCKWNPLSGIWIVIVYTSSQKVICFIQQALKQLSRFYCRSTLDGRRYTEHFMLPLSSCELGVGVGARPWLAGLGGGTGEGSGLLLDCEELEALDFLSPSNKLSSSGWRDRYGAAITTVTQMLKHGHQQHKYSFIRQKQF